MKLMRSPSVAVVVIALVAFILAACGSDGTAEESPTAAEESENTPTIEPASPTSESTGAEEETSDQDSEFDVLGGASEDDVVTTASGLQYIVIEEGDGVTPEDGQVVSVHYTGWLEDGTRFDSSLDRGSPFQFALGQGRVIAGWDEGIALVKEGGKARLIIPADLGYGPAGSGGVIPPDATLIFDVELVEILPGSPEDPTTVDEGDYTLTDTGLQYYDIEEGDGSAVEDGQQVIFHYTGWLEDGTKFDSSIDRGQPVGFVVGSEGVMEGWNEGMLEMKVGGLRQLIIPPELAFGEEGAGGVIPPNATLIFEVELLEVR